MNQSLGQRVGSALGWKAAQHAGTKIIFLVRTLILARLLSPDEFGLLAIATVAIGSLLSHAAAPAPAGPWEAPVSARKATLNREPISSKLSREPCRTAAR